MGGIGRPLLSTSKGMNSMNEQLIKAVERWTEEGYSLELIAKSAEELKKMYEEEEESK